MTEGYESPNGSLTDESVTQPALRDAPEGDVLFDLEYGMTYQHGKHRSRSADQIARRTVAEMIYRHLMVSGYVILKRPPSPPHTTPGAKTHLTE